MAPTKFTVIVADDIPLMRLMLSKYVRTAGTAILEAVYGPVDLRVLEAADGEEARALVTNHSVDLMFLDLMMPVMDGLTLLQEVRGELGLTDVKVVVCSAIGDRDVIRRSLDLGADAYVVKPFTLNAVQQKLKEIYGQPITT